MATIIRFLVLTSSPNLPCFDLASPVLRAPAFQDLPIWPSGGGPFSVSDSLIGALPHQARTPVPKVAMIYKLASSRPAQAVDTSDNSRRVDGDGGGAAGTSLAGVGAVSAFGNQLREIPFQVQSTGAVLEPITSRRSRSSRTSRASSIRAARSPGLTRSLGNVSLPPGGVAARRTDDPLSPLDHSDPDYPLQPPPPSRRAARPAAHFFPPPTPSSPPFPLPPPTLPRSP